MTIVTMVQVLMLVACDKCSVSGLHLSCDTLLQGEHLYCDMLLQGVHLSCDTLLPLLMVFYQHSYSIQRGKYTEEYNAFSRS